MLILTVELVLTVVEAVNNIQSTLPGDNGASQIPWAVHREAAGEDQSLTVKPSDSVSRNSNLKLSWTVKERNGLMLNKLSRISALVILLIASGGQ